MNLFGKLNYDDLESLSNLFYDVRKDAKQQGKEFSELDITFIKDEISKLKFQKWNDKFDFYQIGLGIFAIFAYIGALCLIATQAFIVTVLMGALPSVFFWTALAEGGPYDSVLDLASKTCGVAFFCSSIVFLVLLPIYTLIILSVFITVPLFMLCLRKRGEGVRIEEIEYFIRPVIVKNAAIYLTHENETVRECAYKLLKDQK